MRKHAQIVVVSDVEDAHIPYVQAHLDQPVQLIDPRSLIGDSRLSFELRKDRMVAIYNGVKLNHVSGVWHRKPRSVSEDQLPVAAAYKEYSLSALHEHAGLLLAAFQDAFWISDPHAIWKANNKNWQLELAKQLGFRVPATLITSDNEAAAKFIDAHKQVIVKPLANVLPVVDGIPKAFFATIANARQKPDLRYLHLAPAIFQQLIDPMYDIRVTVVGGQVFAAAIHTKNECEDSTVRDWRALQFDESARIEPTTLPADIAGQCVQHVRSLNLQFGALDFVVDKKGTLWFLENNPNGQWAFVEKATGQPIGKTIAQLLIGGKL